MDVQALSVLTTLNKSTSTADTKLLQLNELKSAIKHLRVPVLAQATIFDCVRTAIGSQTAPQLVPVGFSTLSHLIKRLGLQKDDAAIAGYGPKLLPVLLERLGDLRETHRAAASQALADIWMYAPTEVERVVRETVLPGLNSRAREAGMIWVVHMHQTEGLQFRTFVPLIVAALEDADSQLRETAKASVVSLFSSAPARAKVDLKKQLASHDIRKNTISFILSKLDDNPQLPQSAPPIAGSSFQDTLSDFTTESMDLSGSVDALESTTSTSIEPLYFHSQSEWEQLVRGMQPCFVGRESNDNWEIRDRNVSLLRRAVKGNAPTDFPVSFSGGIKLVLDGVAKVSDSLRTTVSTNGCHLTQELFHVLGPAMDSCSEIVLQTFIKLAGSTKRINSIHGSETVAIVFETISYSQRSLQHIWFAAADKNVQLRLCAPCWLRTLVGKHKAHKTMLHNTGGVELVQKTLIKGLTDANPKVRETSRETYKVVIGVWPDMAEPVLATLSTRDRQMLENGRSVQAHPMSRGSSTAGTSSHTSKLTLREAIAAQKRSAATKQAAAVLERPASAMSTLSPNRNQLSSLHANHRPGYNGLGSMSSLTGGGVGFGHAGSLLSGPARRPRRPEITRPATADPYASRNVGRGTPSGSPLASPIISAAPILHPSSLISSKSPPRMAFHQAPSRMASSNSLKTKDWAVSSAPSVKPHNRPFTIAPQSAKPPEPEYIGFASQNESLDIDMDTDSVEITNPVLVSDVDEQLHVDPVTESGEADIDDRSNVADIIMLAEEAPLNPTLLREVELFTAVERSVAASPAPDSPSTLESFSVVALESQTSSTLLDRDVIEAEARVPPESSISTPDSHAEIENAVVDHTVPELKVATQAPVSQPEPQTPPQTAVLTSSDMFALSIRDNNDKVLHSGPDLPPLTISTVPAMINSPTHGLDANRIRGLLLTVVDRLRSRTLDPHGLRRIQDILRNPVVSDVFADNPTLVGNLMTALLGLLETRQDDASVVAVPKSPSRPRVTSLKTQTLSTIRVLVTVRQKDILASSAADPVSTPALWVALLRTLVRSRRDYADTEHISSEMWRLATDICTVAPARQLSDAILVLVDVLETVAPSPVTMREGVVGDDGDADPEGDARVAVMGLRVLRMLVTKVPVSPNTSTLDPIPNPARLGQLVVCLLNSTNPDVRYDVLEFCLSFHRRLITASIANKELSEATSGTLGGKQNGTPSTNTTTPSKGNKLVAAVAGGIPMGLDFSSSPFWKVVSGVKEQHLNLITYYLARNGIESG